MASTLFFLHFSHIKEKYVHSFKLSNNPTNKKSLKKKNLYEGKPP